MTVVAFDVFEADVFEDAIFQDFTSNIIDRVSILEKLIYIKKDITNFHPVDDLYPEMRSLRRIDESIRVVDNPVSAQGNEPAGANFTPRRVVFNNGWLIALDNLSNGILTIAGEMISDDGKAGAQLVTMDKLPTGVSMLVNYAPPSSEVITVATGSGVTAGDVVDIANAVDTILQDDFTAVPTAVEAQLADDFAALPTAAEIAIQVETQLVDDFAGITASVDNNAVAAAVRANLTAELQHIVDLARDQGLIVGFPVTITPTGLTVGTIVKTFAKAGDNTTVNRTS